MTNNLKTTDQQRAELFLEEFVSGLVGSMGDDIDFILLFGSVARGEFILGKSDVDLIIQTKNDAAVRRVERFAESLFWRLDEKHGMQFEKVLSTGVSESYNDASKHCFYLFCTRPDPSPEGNRLCGQSPLL